MKKLLLIIGLLCVAGIPLMAEGVTMGGQLDLNYFMYTPTDDNDDEADESFFGNISTKLTAKAELGENLTGFVKLNVYEDYSAGIDTNWG
jgi:hypothetical protein